MATIRHHLYSLHHHYNTLLLFLLTFPSVLLCRSYVITSGTWRFRGQHPIAYERATARVLVQDDASLSSTTTATNETPVLLLNGFGVGSFHQHRLIHELLGKQLPPPDDDDASKNNDENIINEIVVYCIDYLGQGSSWPYDCQDGQGVNEVGLRYCGNTWVEQITGFIQDVILKNDDNNDNGKKNKKKLHIVGNSVGGHLAAFVAAKSPQLIQSLVLLNPTPFWGLNLPGWNGVLPAPIIPKLIGRVLFDVIRDLNTINVFLNAVYANGRLAFDETLMQQIRACTEGSGGHAAFSSILWSPPISITVPSTVSSATSSSNTGRTTINNFYDCLRYLAQENARDTVTSTSSSSSSPIPILLVFGKNDPWCKPALARRMMQQNSRIRYMELSRVGHCPNHEAPIATARILTTWWQHYSTDYYNPAGDDDKAQQPLLLPQCAIQESWGTTRMQEKSREEISLSLVDRLATVLV